MKHPLIQVVAFMPLVAVSVRQSLGQNQYVRTTNLLAVADSFLSSGNANISFGVLPFVYAGVDAAGTNRALFRFDVSGIPTNATVTNVTISLVSYAQPTLEVLFGLSRMLTNWEEYTVSWNDRSIAAPWTEPGGLIGTDFNSSPSAFGLPGATNRFTDNGGNPYFGLVNDVQTWLNHPEQNFGWLLAAVDEGLVGSTFLIDSREATGSEPVLTVGYTQPFTPPSIHGVAVSNGIFRLSFNVEPFHGYGVQRKEDLGGTNWAPVAVFDPPPFPTDATFYDLLTPGSRFYRVVSSK